MFEFSLLLMFFHSAASFVLAASTARMRRYLFALNLVNENLQGVVYGACRYSCEQDQNVMHVTALKHQ